MVSGAFLTAATFVAAISGWWMVRESQRRKRATPDQEPTVATMPDSDSASMFRPAARLSFLVMILAGIGLIWTGDVQGKLMFEQQPMKMASAESLCHNETDPDFSILTIRTQATATA